MMSADSTRTIQGISDELAASKMLIQELLELLRDARGLLNECSGLLAARQAREARPTPIVLPAETVH